MGKLVPRENNKTGAYLGACVHAQTRLGSLIDLIGRPPGYDQESS